MNRLSVFQVCLVALQACSESPTWAVKDRGGSSAPEVPDSGPRADASSPDAAGDAGENADVVGACVKALAGKPTSSAGSPDAGTGLAYRVELGILVVSARDVGTNMVKAGLEEGLVPCTEVDLTDPNRPTIDDALLSDTTGSTRRAKFQAVVLPNEAPTQLSAAELDALARFEREFKVRQFSSHVYPSPEVGLNYPANGGYDGPLDGLTASVTDAGNAGSFAYLNGPVAFDDLDPSVSESYGYLARPLPADTEGMRSFTPLVTIPIPSSDNTPGVLLGVYTDNGREQLVMTCSLNSDQFQQQALFQGILDWLTYGVHFGTERNYLSLHIDDVFLANARWNAADKCTVGSSCELSVTPPKIVMTADDVDYLNAWKTKHGITIDLVFVGSGYDNAIDEGPFPVGARFLELRSSFRWVSHTYDHAYLGCIRDLSVTPYRCETDADGATSWTSYDEIYYQIRKNQDFAARLGLPFASDELVSGEHSGLGQAAQEPSENPNLAQALSDTGVAWIASDSSREPAQRAIGSTFTSPRYPLSIFYNVATKVDAVSEYNYLYNTAADGGSGLCEDDPRSTCIAPLDPAIGFDSYIVPINARNILQHVLSNSARAHFAHQSNLAEERILYPVLDKVLADYTRTFASTAKLVSASISELGTELKNQSDWRVNYAKASGYIQGGQLTLSVDGSDAMEIPLTVPGGTASEGAAPLGAYGGHRTGWSSVGSEGKNFALPSSVGYAR